jgi:hypothetical protein
VQLQLIRASPLDYGPVAVNLFSVAVIAGRYNYKG